jgi:uncharacterized DUF497 family protein
VTYRFEWDPAKAEANRSKHGVDFLEATGILRDPLAMTLYDEAHSIQEDRWITLGRVESGAVLLMVHTFEDVDDQVAVVRVISARTATRQERSVYERQ